MDTQPETKNHPVSANEQEEMAQIYMVEQAENSWCVCVCVCRCVCVKGGWRWEGGL